MFLTGRVSYVSLLSKSEIERLAEKREGWCVSIFMPTHRAGQEIQQDPIRLKNLLGQAEERLVAVGLRHSEAQSLLAPAQELIPRQEFWRHQSDGLALFLSPTVFQFYRLPFNFEELMVAANRFHVKPLLPLLSGDGRFYVLALSQNEIRLLQGTRYSVGQVDLTDVPESLAEILKWDDPEKRLQWHSRTGNQSNRRAAIFHGHGVASADDPKDYIRRYFHRIDEGLTKVLAGEAAPLVLAGVEYLLPIYEQVNSYPYLMDGSVTGNPERQSVKDLHQRAWKIVAPLFQQEQQQAAEQYQRLAGGGSELVSNELKAVVPAAYDGRVAVLFVGMGLQRWGGFDPQTRTVIIHEIEKPGDVDLLDYACVQTLLSGGTVYAVESDELPDAPSLAAVLRY
jgi:hypothetical protein